MEAIAPMLAEVLNDSIRLDEIVRDNAYAIEQKFDGHRIMLHCGKDGKLRVTGRHGRLSQHHWRLQDEIWTANLEALKGRSVVLDAELIGDRAYIFDAPYIEGLIQPSSPFVERRTALEILYEMAGFNSSFRLVANARTEGDKAHLVMQCILQKAEGVIIKRLDAPYISGRTDAMLKYKFTKTVDAIITDMHTEGKNNATLSVYRDGELVEIGRCSLHGKEPVEIGQVAEIEYLYFSDDGRLVQPVFRFTRDDKASEECTYDQLESSRSKSIVEL